MNRIKYHFLFIVFISLTTLLSAQQKEAYRLGTLWLRNAQALEGYIWTAPGMSDRLDYIFYKPELNDLEDKYYADDFSQFELWQGSRRFYSMVLPIGNNKVRKIAELHFKGDYSLYSAFVGQDIIYFIADNTGTITRLDNTIDNGVEGNGSSGNFNYEYRETLASTFSDMPGIVRNTENLNYSRKDLSRVLADYHSGKKLYYVSYPVPKADWFISAGAGMGWVRNRSNLTAMAGNFLSPISYINLLGEIVSHTGGKAFARVGLSRSGGLLFRDYNLESPLTNTIVFYEERNRISLMSYGCLFGLNMFEIGRFTPYVAAGAEYTSYRSFNNQVMKETLYREEQFIITEWKEYVNLPRNIPSVLAEAGANFKAGQMMYLRAGVSYSQFFDKAEMLSSRINLTVSCVYKLF